MAGRTLEQLRRKAGLRQMDVAVAIGTSPARVSDWERGRRSPSLRYIRPLADALGVTVEEVIDAVGQSDS